MEFPNVNNRLAFFDFDRTLVAHQYSEEYTKAQADGYLMECVFSLTSLAVEHADDRPLPCMQWYVKKLAQEGYGLFCLTHEVFNLRDRLKQKQLARFYPDVPMTYLTVDTPEHKIDMMKAVAMTECCAFSDVIFVDDRMETVQMAKVAGMDAKHLSDIVVLYEQERDVQEQDILIRLMNGAPVDVHCFETVFNGNTEDRENALLRIMKQNPQLFKTSFMKQGVTKDSVPEDLYQDCQNIVECTLQRNG